MSTGTSNSNTREGRMDIRQAWVAECDMVMQGAAVAADINGDGYAEFITAAYQAVIAVDRTGKEMWRVPTNQRYMTCPVVLERPGDSALIYAADMSWSTKPESTLSCIDGAGKIVWQAKVASVYWASPALADINGDGRVELVQGDAAGIVHAYDALTGALVWERPLDGECSSPGIGDLDGDGAPEIAIATTTGRLYVLNGAGEIVREKLLGGTVFNPVGEYAAYRVCSPVLFANSRGEGRMIASVQEPGSRRILCFNGTLDLLWERETPGGIGPSVSVADFDGDGRADIFAPAQSGRLFRFDEDGRVVWDFDTQAFCYAPGAIVDVDGDGALEYVLCTELGKILVYNQAGEIVFTHQCDSRRAHRTTPAFGKIADGPRGLVFGITGSDTGRLYCFTVPASADTHVEWHAFRGSPRSTGSWFGLQKVEAVRMEPENLVWDAVLTQDEITFRVTNPAPGKEPLEAEATVLAPDGVRQGATGIIAGEKGVLKMPVAISAPGKYRFEWCARKADGEVLARGSRALTLSPYRNDQALARKAVVALRDAVAGVPTDAGFPAVLREECAAIEQEAGNLAVLQLAGAASAFSPEVVARTGKLNARAKRALALAGIAPTVLSDASGCPVLPFEGRMWENLNVDAELPGRLFLPLAIRRRCVTGEHEPVSIKLLNVSPDTVMVRTTVGEVPGGLVITPHKVTQVPTNPDSGKVVWDPIIPLGEVESVAIPRLETREFWFDVDAAKATAGEHTVKVTFSAGGKETVVEIALRVLPFEMGGYDAMRLCMWASYNQHTVPDLLAHGATVFLTGLPPAKAVEQGGQTRLEVDFTTMDQFLAPLEGHDVFLLLTGLPQVGVGEDDPSYVARLADYFEQVMSHLAAKGIPEEHVALYTWDEVGGNGWDAVRRYVAFGKLVLKARPTIKFYVNGGGDLPMFEELVEIAAIWSPAFFMLDDDTPVMRYLWNTKKTMWTYNCAYMYARPMGWNTKAINIVGEFRMQAVFAVRYGATGIGYWCYNHGESMWNPVHAEYPIVYQTSPDGPVTSSRRWEAVRESVEDSRIVVALREKLADASVSDAAKAKIRHLVEVTLPGMADKSLTEMHLGTAPYVLDDTNNDAMVAAFREELLDCVELVSG
ncbi:MAG TPA: PQQ-binding-like beta-propeller repeat protein [Candidatus Latescibacteria bacterium]|nr:PQQ-binding-like beta-propeller repeat protein [Candidatus Latescibacterota bacterium]